MMQLTQETLKELLHYDPATGVFSRRIAESNSVRVGDVAGWVNNKGYLHMYIRGKVYKAHRVAWLFMCGEWPKEEIDHIDGDPANNAWGNLREASRKQNTENRRLSSQNTSGYRGVTWSKGCGKWRAYVKHHGKYISLGYFDALEVAAKAAAAKRAELFTHDTGRGSSLSV